MKNTISSFFHDPVTLLQIVVTALLAVTSFFGGAWRPRDDQERRRLHWSAFILVGLVTCSVLLQYIKTRQSDTKEKSELQLRATIIDALRTESADETALAKAQAALAGDAKNNAAKSEARAEAAGAELKRLGTENDKLQRDLSRSSAAAQSAGEANVITAFANSDLSVRTVGVGLFITESGNRENTYTGALLPHFREDLCRRFIGVSVNVYVTPNYTVSMTYQPTDTKPYYRSPDKSPDRASLIETLAKQEQQQENFVNEIAGIKQRSWNGVFYEMDVRNEFLMGSAAEVYSTMDGVGTENVEISATYPDAASGSKKPSALTEEFLKAGSPRMPVSCSDQIGHYFLSAFDAGLTTILVPRPHREASPATLAHPNWNTEVIDIPMKRAVPRRNRNGTWSVVFKVSQHAFFGDLGPIPTLFDQLSQSQPLE